MKVKVRLVSQFKKYGGNKLDENNQLKINNNTSVRELLEILEIPRDKNKVVLVDGRSRKEEYLLKNGEKIIIYNLLVGG